MKTKQILSSLLILASLTFFLPSCAINPVTGKKELMFLSEEGELRMGAQNDPQIVAAFGLYPNEDMQTFINRHGREMAAISHRPDLNYEFKILDSPVVNAFAVPGGYVYFTRGIMAHFNNEAEFMGVLGHEIGHITARHSARQMTSQYLMMGGFIVGMLASEEFQKYGDLAMMGIQILGLSFSRAHESESDKLGVEYSTKIGYDAREMAGFFSTIKRIQDQAGGEVVPNFLSTHPDPADRFQKVQQMATQRQAKNPNKNYEVGRDSYLRMIDGLIYGEDPKQGYVADGYFFHPELLFQFPVPNDWNVNNTPSQVVITPKNTQEALMIFTLGKGNTLQEAAQNFIEEAQLSRPRSQQTRINGFSTLIVDSEQVNPQDSARTQVAKVLSYFIQDNEKQLIYAFHGMTYEKTLYQYSPIFRRSMEGFRRLTDRRRIDVKPERVRIQTVPRDATFSQTMSTLGMPTSRHEELALLNGMQLTDQLTKGMLIKTISE
jgi:predicted Zn-dependent protease